MNFNIHEGDIRDFNLNETFDLIFIDLTFLAFIR